MLVDRGLAASRPQAVELIQQGHVIVSGSVADKPARLVAPSEPVELLSVVRYVGRGGEKLAAALEGFSLDVSGCRALDAGASTGGFTDCLLQAGAAHVYAVDVGHGQLHARLRADSKVTCRERLDIRDVTLDDLDGVPVDLAVADLSFIPLSRVVDALTGPLVRTGSPLVVLVKPQFEAGRVEVSRGRGVIRDPEVQAAALAQAIKGLRQAGTGVLGAMPSPITGHAGNVEFLVWGRVGIPGRETGSPAPEMDRELVDSAMARLRPEIQQG